MIVRTAILEGTVAPADKADFDRHMRTTVVAALGRYPGLIKAVLREIAEADADAPSIHMAFDLYFHSLADMHAALASPVRQAVRAELGLFMPRFQGRVYHVVFEETAQTGGQP
ncbi:MAG: EthD family reductase [Betaproteobacteria bacterium]|nr:EthD family reductase [Betaproteobacteria bacterium]NBY06182.1 EthD family reductase [Betaproteobacteria bacterium]